mmetsp:Transcript_5803/g.13692  ORF Transcript_5803/g.13692 Transcript_5803/m.13692 type:complete len:219 (+) Transcript_5803:1005-1661(+)
MTALSHPFSSTSSSSFSSFLSPFYLVSDFEPTFFLPLCSTSLCSRDRGRRHFPFSPPLLLFRRRTCTRLQHTDDCPLLFVCMCHILTTLRLFFLLFGRIYTCQHHLSTRFPSLFAPLFLLFAVSLSSFPSSPPLPPHSRVCVRRGGNGGHVDSHCIMLALAVLAAEPEGDPGAGSEVHCLCYVQARVESSMKRGGECDHILPRSLYSMADSNAIFEQK